MSRVPPAAARMTRDGARLLDRRRGAARSGSKAAEDIVISAGLMSGWRPGKYPGKVTKSAPARSARSRRDIFKRGRQRARQIRAGKLELQVLFWRFTVLLLGGSAGHTSARGRVHHHRHVHRVWIDRGCGGRRGNSPRVASRHHRHHKRIEHRTRRKLGRSRGRGERGRRHRLGRSR